jgi:hypothetical protein
MSTRISTLALAAAFAVAALASTGASAKVMGVIINKPKPVVGVVIKPPHPVLGVVINHVHDHDWDGPHFTWWWTHHRAPIVVEQGVTSTVVPVASGPVSTGPCTCLTKQYLQDGSVMFKDICTKESALATPAELRAQVQ